MKFRNDNQRKAIFANLNRFSSKSETGESLRPILRSGSKEQSLQDYLDNNDGEVKGYTGSGFDIYPIITSGDSVSRSIGPSVLTETGSLVIPENTVILAGEDYKRYEGGKDPSKRKLRRIILVGDKLLKTDKYNKEFVSGLAEIDRERGRPVYSKESDMELAKKILVNIHNAYKPTEDSDITLALDALDNNDVSTAKTIIDTMIQSEKLYQNEDDFGMYKASAALKRVIGDGK